MVHMFSSCPKRWMDVEERSGRPATNRTNINIAAVRGNRRITTQVLSEDVKIIYGIVQSFITKYFSMRRLSAKFVPKLVPIDKKRTLMFQLHEISSLIVTRKMKTY